MKANEFIRWHGLLESKKHLEWMARVGARRDIHGWFMDDLKRLIESHELVEQLGGYEKAKEILSRERNSENIDPVIYLNGNEILIDAICDALLEYRRQHNIFESDDLVTSKKWVDGSIHKIELMDSEDRTLKIFSHDMAFSYWVDSRNYRHATDAEIKAGKRLGVNQ